MLLLVRQEGAAYKKSSSDSLGHHMVALLQGPEPAIVKPLLPMTHVQPTGPLSVCNSSLATTRREARKLRTNAPPKQPRPPRAETCKQTTEGPYQGRAGFEPSLKGNSRERTPMKPTWAQKAMCRIDKMATRITLGIVK